MAVDTSIESLFQSLKLEDPWVPPRPWEFIPSESGIFPHSQSSYSNIPLYDASTVSEASLVRLTINALQGLQSALFSIKEHSALLCSEPANRTHHRILNLWNRFSSSHALGNILQSIGYFGSLVFLLRKFIDHFVCKSSELSENQIHRRSLVNQAFAIAVGKVLEGFVCALGTLDASIRSRHLFNDVNVSLTPSFGKGSLTSVTHSGITLLEAYLHTRELRTKIEALGSICNLHYLAPCFSDCSFEDLVAKATLAFDNFPRGGELLTYLYTQLQVADPLHSSLLKFLFLQSFEPYYGFLRSWIYEAKISDPYEEFPVEYVDNSSCSASTAGTSCAFLLATVKDYLFLQQLRRNYVVETAHHVNMDLSSGVNADMLAARLHNSSILRVFPHDINFLLQERDGVALPCFLKDFSIPLIRAGQQIQVLMKLLEFCYINSAREQTYADILPSWNKILDDPFLASPLTFNKEKVEAMVFTRNGFYERLQNKLEYLLTKFEIRYQQVPSHCLLPFYVDKHAGGVKDPSLYPLDDCLNSTSPTLRRGGSNVGAGTFDSEVSSAEDELSEELDPFQLSECSSLNSSEGQTESEQLPNNVFALEEKYLSALIFSRTISGGTSSKIPTQNEKPLSMDSVLLETFEATNIQPNSDYTDEKCEDVSAFGLKVKNRDGGVFNEGISWFRNILDCLMEEAVDNGTSAMPNSSHLHSWKFKYDSKFLSMNPMLTKYLFFQENKIGEKCIADRVDSLSCFDFSSVEDPCRIYLDKSADPNDKFEGPQPSSSSNPHRASVSIEKEKDSHVHQPALKFNDSEKEVNENISCGNSWETMLKDCKNSASINDEDQRKVTASIFEIPVDFIIDKCLLQEIQLQYKYISNLTIQLLEKKFHLQEHLLALRRYHFMELADWADLFLMSLRNNKFYMTEANNKISEIQGFLELAIERSSCERDRSKDRLFIYTKEQGATPLSTSAVGVHFFDFVGLGYKVDWPVSIVLSAAALKTYAEIFTFLMQIKLASLSLSDLWCSLKELRNVISKNDDSKQHDSNLLHLNILMKMRHQVNHFVSTLQQYIQSQLSNVLWCSLLYSLKHKVKDMMDLESVHMAYLTNAMYICFLSDETRVASGFVENILQCAVDFRACLIGGLDRGNPWGNLSRINISQVLSIKEIFDRNLKELHLCCLKSVKHGVFGLSHLWEYLNYNDYYSDVIGNEISYLAFPT